MFRKRAQEAPEPDVGPSPVIAIDDRTFLAETAGRATLVDMTAAGVLPRRELERLVETLAERR